ncbi:MAG: hypothetical protein XU15_C0002G0392 [candidate division NC10 bacterium CSP1-5]|nr:MAG: hypothetical protein XU15_C0002G0392 [candidate division NC10 bacterium CSP1-5]
MRRLLIFSLTFLLLWPSIAPAFHDSMPEEIYGKLQGFGVTFLEYDGPVLEKQGCSHVQQTLLKSGSLGKSLGIALFALDQGGTSQRLIGVEVRDADRNPVFLWRASDFWQIAACHFPDEYGGKG